MPVVAFPLAAGLTEQDVVAAVLGLTQDRVDEIRTEIQRTIHGVTAITARFHGLGRMTQPEADNEFANMDAQLTRLLALRHTLQARVDAHLSQQRIAADVAAHTQQQVA